MSIITLAILLGVAIVLLFFFPEISLFLEKRKLNGAANRIMIEEATRAVRVLAKKGTSSFIILKKKDDLSLLLENGEEVNKVVTAPTLAEYFFLEPSTKKIAVLDSGFLRSVNLKTAFSRERKNMRLSKEKEEAVLLTKKCDAVVLMTNRKGSIAIVYRGNITPRVSNLKLENVLFRFFKTKGRILRERKIVVNRI